MVQEGTK